MRAAGAAAALSAPGTAHRAAAAELIVNGNFVAEDFNAAAAWLGVDDKYGTASQADDIAVWSDTAPNYGAILRICQDAAEVGGSGGGVWGAHIEQSLALQAGRTYTLGFWAADLGPSMSSADRSSRDGWLLALGLALARRQRR